ncbi:transposable element Tcb2 transposase [Trichonephila clavipes]|nr:transposable element Tcb2 transposase [Trichonephila clavipes]
MLGPVDPRDVIYTKTRLRTPSNDQSSRRQQHRKKCTRTANCFIGPHPGTGSAFTRDPLVWRHHVHGAPLVLIRSTVTAQLYVHDILQPHELPLMQWLPGAIFQYDNIQPHTARVSQDCLRTVITLPLPTGSPDLSPMKNI